MVLLMLSVCESAYLQNLTSTSESVNCKIPHGEYKITSRKKEKHLCFVVLLLHNYHSLFYKHYFV
jgi:hypothetical protein